MRTCSQFEFSIRIRFNTQPKAPEWPMQWHCLWKKNKSWKIVLPVGKSGPTEKTFTISSAVLSNRLEAIRLMFKHWMNNQYWIKDFRSLLMAMSFSRRLASVHTRMWSKEKYQVANATETHTHTRAHTHTPSWFKICIVCLSVGFNYCTIMLYLSMNVVWHC